MYSYTNMSNGMQTFHTHLSNKSRNTARLGNVRADTHQYLDKSGPLA